MTKHDIILVTSSLVTCHHLVVEASSYANPCLIVWLMTAYLLYGSLNFRSRLSFEGSYPGSYYLGSPKPFSIYYISYMILSYNP